MNNGNDFSFKWGAVTLLDFLGWKGVWMNDYKQQSNSLKNLAKLIQEIEEKCTTLCKDYGTELEFISISDTIALFTPCISRNDDAENYNILKLHAELCSKVMDISAASGFALRGAITIGEFDYWDNIIIGPGVDECASWYEQADWLGVIFAPSAQFIINALRNNKKDEKNLESSESDKADGIHPENDQILWRDENIVAYNDIPVKNGLRGIEYCVQWGKDVTILNKVLKNTISLSREIAIKYINTNKYLYALRPSEVKNGKSK